MTTHPRSMPRSGFAALGAGLASVTRTVNTFLLVYATPGMLRAVWTVTCGRGGGGGWVAEHAHRGPTGASCSPAQVRHSARLRPGSRPPCSPGCPTWLARPAGMQNCRCLPGYEVTRTGA